MEKNLGQYELIEVVEFPKLEKQFPADNDRWGIVLQTELEVNLSFRDYEKEKGFVDLYCGSKFGNPTRESYHMNKPFSLPFGYGDKNALYQVTEEDGKFFLGTYRKKD